MPRLRGPISSASLAGHFESNTYRMGWEGGIEKITAHLAGSAVDA